MIPRVEAQVQYHLHPPFYASTSQVHCVINLIHYQIGRKTTPTTAYSG